MPCARQKKHNQWHIWLCLGLATLCLASATAVATAQPPSTAYWEYAAAGRIQQVITADINADGLDEFLITTEGGRVDLLGADGFRQWSYEVGQDVLSLTTLNLDGRTHPPREIAIGISNWLLLLETNGDLRAQIPLEPLTAPTALLTGGDITTAQTWITQYAANPILLSPFRATPDDNDEILVLLQSGQAHLYDATGHRLWRYTRNNNPLIDTSPHAVITDLDGDGLSETMIGAYDPIRRFSQVVLLETDGSLTWDQPVSGRITALTPITFSDQPHPVVAVGTSLGNVNLYNGQGQRLWPRTVNRPVTALTAVTLADGPALAVGTSVGSLILFNAQGQRILTRHLDDTASRHIISLSAAPLADVENQPIVAIVLGPSATAGDTDVLLMGEDGRILKTLADMDEQGIAHLLDINHDSHGELLLGRFPTLTLSGLGIGVSTTAQEWAQNLRAVPRAILVLDFNQDGKDELLIGTDDGRLHNLNPDGSSQWIIQPGGQISFLSTIPATATNPLQIVLTRNTPFENDEIVSWLEVRHTNGEKIWDTTLPSPVTSLLVGNIDGQEPEIIVGTSDGQLITYTPTGTRLWENTIPGPLRHLHILDTGSPNAATRYELIAANDREIYKLRGHLNPILTRIASFDQPLVSLHVLAQPGSELAVRLLALSSDGYAYGLNWRGILLPPWPFPLGASPTDSLAATEIVEDVFDIQQARDETFLIATNTGQVLGLRVEKSRPRLLWRIHGIGQITDLYWGDVDGDSRPNLAVASQNREVLLFTRDPAFLSVLELASSAFALTTVQRDAQEKSDLVMIATNGLVQLFRAQENRPPLLTNPLPEVRQGQYNISITVKDVENDQVQVSLEVFNPSLQRWQRQEARQLSNGNGQVQFSMVNPPASSSGVTYRFHYQDAFHEGYVLPVIGPLPIIPSPFLETRRTLLWWLGGLGAITAVILFRQAEAPAARARRFYRHLTSQPQNTLCLLEEKYAATGGSPDFLLYLTSQARQNGDWITAGLTDGLFLLADQPRAALTILQGAITDIQQRNWQWNCLQRWFLTCQTAQALLESPSITELSLLRPQLVELLNFLEESDEWSPTFDLLLPILTNLRDSERVDLIEDRLVYLNEAAAQLTLITEQLPEFSDRIDKTLVRLTVERWLGLVSARVEELRGRAELVVTLKTRHIVPNGRTNVAVEIRNNGRAAAEEVIAILDERPAYLVYSPPQVIPLIPPGRSRQVLFAIEPQVPDRFRLALSLTFHDRNRRNKTAAFGDMVHLLSPTRDFKPLDNPYIPGSPLRPDSTLFYGREELFQFIAENIGGQPRRNVLILIGQRRTGKTSALLQLKHHLPPHLLPIYIDCQSLGVTPGIPALLSELAWLIADTLSHRGIDIDAPEPDAWATDPTGLFQRHFLPAVRASLPPKTSLMLVFDEFEAFENLVQDGILPYTFFPYMRHLMQHSEGLGFIFVGTHRLEEMSADYWSVLFNIGLYQKIGYLSPEAATRLITEPVAASLVYDDLALDKILRVTAGHPYFLQLVCYTLVKQANSHRTGYVTISDVNAALDEMLRLGEVHFAFLWQRASHTERVLLTAVAHLIDTDTPFHPEDIVRVLQPYGLRLQPAEVTTALNALVERDIMRELTENGLTLYELNIGLVGLWVEKNKSLSKLLNAPPPTGPLPPNALPPSSS